MQALAASLQIGFTMSGKGALHWHASSGAYRAGGGGGGDCVVLEIVGKFVNRF